ncbi:MAG: hypothetical protein DWQ02_03815 [Bacteroidetes bacterium]|nr:MAG: hypothetical protein DWQ02_03815 [Bacteroidota bacterium]
MKQLLFVAVLFLAYSCGGQIEVQNPVESEQDSEKSFVTVFDFHMKHRCKTCINIEKSTKKVISEQFSKEAEQQLVFFKVVDAEDPKNEKLVEEFGAYGTTLAICKTKNGKREIEDITPWAFKRSGNDKFEPELTEKIRTALAELEN